jgi:NTE family protein
MPDYSDVLPSRRAFFGAGAGAALALGIATTAGAEAPAGFSGDGLAIPIPATPSFGHGKQRALVLGGGGEYLVSFMLGYMHALDGAGIHLDENADIIVGTSAGSIVGSTIAGGHLRRLTAEFDFFGKFPKLLADLVPVAQLNDSQERAVDVARHCANADPATIRELGRAAMAARNPDVEKLQTAIGVLTGNSHWPSPNLYTTANDCYSGERLVVSQRAGVPIAHAVSASMSLPGNVGPTWIKNRACMDGGMCQTSTHCDLVAGAERALVFSLGDGSPGAPRFSSMPNTIRAEIAHLRTGGTRTMLVVSDVTPGTNLMSPEQILPALKSGYAKGRADAAAIRRFWT